MGEHQPSNFDTLHVLRVAEVGLQLGVQAIR